MASVRPIDVGVGIFVAVGIAAMVWLALKVSNVADMSAAPGYSVAVYFDDIGGLKVKAPVRMGGVLVGRVSGIGYDSKRYQAKVMLKLDGRYDEIPTDTMARIFTAGLLGEQYVSLEPGGGVDTFLAEGGEISMSESALVLEKVIGQFLFSQAAGGEQGTKN